MDDKTYVEEPYYINQFSYDFLNEFFSKYNYKTVLEMKQPRTVLNTKYLKVLT